MPVRDGTGPAGRGPLTGRGMGCCAGYMAAGTIRPGMPWCGMGGHGRGHRNMFFANGMPGRERRGNTNTEPDAVKVLSDRELLEQQAEILENQLDEVKNYLKDLGEQKQSRGNEDFQA